MCGWMGGLIGGLLFSCSIAPAMCLGKVVDKEIRTEVADNVAGLEIGEATFKRLDDLHGWERLEQVHRLSESVTDDALENALLKLATMDLKSRSVMLLVYDLALRACRTGDVSLVNAFVRENPGSEVYRVYYYVGWEMADIDFESGIEMLDVLHEDSISAYLKGMAWSLKRHDPSLLIAHYDRFRHTSIAVKAMKEHVGAMLETNPMRALELFDEYLGDSNAWDLRHEILRKLVREDVDAAKSYARSAETPEDQIGRLRSLVNSLSAENGPQAVELVQQLIEDGLPNPLLGERELWHGLISNWASNSPEDCLKWIAEIEDPLRRANLMRSVNLGRVAEADFERLTRLFGDDGILADAEHMRRGLYESWSHRDPAGYIQWALENEVSHWETRLSWYSWHQLGENHPEMLEALATNLPTGDGRIQVISKVAEDWPSEDIGGFMDWVGELDDDVAMDHAMVRFFEVRDLGDDLGREIELCQTLPEGKARDAYLVNIVDSVSGSDGLQALELATSIGDAKSRAETLVDLGDTLAYSMPDEALRYGLAHPEISNSAFVPELLDTLATEDAVKAYQYLDYLSGHQAELRVSQSVFDGLFDQDEAFAVESITNEVSQVRRDGGFMALAEALSEERPEESLAYAGRIEDPTLRLAAFVDGYRTLKTHYPQRAQAWLENSGLAEEDFQGLDGMEEEVFEFAPFTLSSGLDWGSF